MYICLTCSGQLQSFVEHCLHIKAPPGQTNKHRQLQQPTTITAVSRHIMAPPGRDFGSAADVLATRAARSAQVRSVSIISIFEFSI